MDSLRQDLRTGVRAFGVLRVRPRLGRGVSEQDRRSKAAVVISDPPWRRRFAADPGVVAGAFAAAALTCPTRAVLLGATPTDAGTFVSVAVFLFLVALGAAARPAWRSAHVDPAAALREQ